MVRQISFRLVVVALACFAAACSKEATIQLPTAPTPEHGVPARLSIASTPRFGDLAGTALIDVTVRDAFESPIVGRAVKFEATVGTIDETATTNDKGVAEVTWRSSENGKVTATVDALTISTLVVAIAPPPPPPPPSPAPPPPAPIPIPPPTPVPPNYRVTLTASPSTVLVGSPVTLTAAATPQNGAPTPTSFAWDCNNDGTVETTTATNTSSCTYTTAGSVTAKVIVTGGAAFGSATTPVTVQAGAPLFVAITGPLTPAVGANVTYTATVTSSGPIPLSMQWQWDDTSDGNIDIVQTGANGNQRTTAFGVTGKTTIKVKVIDPVTAREATGTLTVTVQ